MTFWESVKEDFAKLIYGADALQYVERQLLLSRVMRTIGALGIAMDASYARETFNVIKSSNPSLSNENIISILVMLIAIMSYTKGQQISHNILLDLDNCNIKKREKRRNPNEWGSFIVK